MREKVAKAINAARMPNTAIHWSFGVFTQPAQAGYRAEADAAIAVAIAELETPSEMIEAGLIVSARYGKARWSISGKQCYPSPLSAHLLIGSRSNSFANR